MLSCVRTAEVRGKPDARKLHATRASDPFLPFRKIDYQADQTIAVEDKSKESRAESLV
jgi:hypothetical protein